MTNKKISALAAATVPLAGTEAIPMAQGGATVQVSIEDVTVGRNVMGATFSATSFVSGIAPRQNPNTAGTTVDYGFRLLDNAGGVGLYGGQSNVPAANTTWLQVRNQSNFALNYNLALNPNGGQVIVGAMTTPKVTSILGIYAGNVEIATSGKGIDFSAVTPAAGMTSKVLTNYEEGTWTPALSASTSGTITVSSAAGLYTRIGRQVTVTGYVDITSVAAPIGSLLMTGLPFACGSALGNRSAVTVYVTGLAATAVTAVVGRIVAGESQLRIDKYSAGSTAAMAADVTNTTVFHFSATYFV